MMKLKATGFSESVPPDYAEARRALAVLIEPGQTFELRALPFGRSSVCTGPDQAIEAIKDFQHAAGVYYTLNPCRVGLDGAAKNADITARRWFLVDIDPERPRDSSATDAEKAAAKEVVLAVVRDLAGCGWPAPVLIDSGNGYHALWRIDLPNDKLSQQWLKRVLEILGQVHDTAQARVDCSVHNAARIAKLPGTWARKGADSQDRPHRMARLLSVPETLAVVPADLIKQLLDEPEPEPAATDATPSRLKLRATSNSADGYCRAALQGECAAVALAPDGDRNNQLNTSAFKVGTLLHYQVYGRADAESALRHAAKRAGLSDHEIDATIRSGLDAGILDPREIPDSGAKVKAPEVKPIPDGAPLIIWASQIKPKQVEWLWPYRLPLGKMCTFAGQGGLGKTFTLCDIAARISTGAEWPFSNGACATPGKVLFISGEDDEDDTLVPRLMECGADLRKIAFLSPASQEHFSLAALELLNRALDQMTDDVRLVVIDPPTSYLGSVDDHKNAELRGLLTPLKRWSAERKAAIIYNNHVNKALGQNVEAAARVMGSVAWVNAVRAAHMFCKDPDDEDRVLFLPIKINVGKKPKALAYRIVSTRGEWAKVEWLGEVDTTADEAVQGQKRKPRRVVATEWLTEQFRQRSEWSSLDIYKDAKEIGLSRNAVFEAKESLPIKARKITTQDGETYWAWVAQDGWPLPAEAPTDGEQPF